MIPAAIHTPSITSPALSQESSLKKSGPAAFAEFTRVMVFYTRESTYTRGCPMDAKEEKKEEYYKGKEVKGKLEKKKEEYYEGKEVKGEK